MRSLWIGLCAIFSFLAHANNDQQYLDQSIKDLDQYLTQNISNFRGCPGVDLVITCGNLKCEPYKNENIENCPADCKENVTVRSYNNITLCDEYTQTQIPQNSLEVADLIKKAKFLNITVKPIGAAHSATDIMCSEGMLIPMKQLNKPIGIEKLNGELVVEAEAGITVFELSEWLHNLGYALKGLPHMGFRDVTIAGAVATGSHGSTVKHTGVISNIVAAIEFVDGLGQIHYLEEKTTDPNTFKALTTGLGMLGIITKLKLKIQDQFNLAVNISYHNDTEILNKGLINSVKDCDYGQLNWFPGVGKYMRTCGLKTTTAAYKNANNELLRPNIPKFIVKPFKKILQYGACHNKVMCLTETVRWWQFKLAPPIVANTKRGKIKPQHYVVGPSHRMVSSHLTEDQDGFFQMDWEIAVPASKAQAALKAIKEHTQKNNTCLPLVGVFIRFAPIESKSLLAHTHADGKDWIEGEAAVFFEMPVYVPVGFSKEQFAEYEGQFNEFTKMLITQFSGRPHWGKNRQWAFDLVLEQGQYKKEMAIFQTVLDKFDPQGVFSNSFSRTLGFK